MASQIAEIAVRKRVAYMSDEYYGQTKSLGEIAFRAFGTNKKSQIRGLENVVNSALVVADVLDFVKRQTGRSPALKLWRYEDFGHELLKAIDVHLRKNAQGIFDNIKFEIMDNRMNEEDQKRIHLHLSREFIRHLSAHYLYNAGLTIKLEGLWEKSTITEDDLQSASREAFKLLDGQQ